MSLITQAFIVEKYGLRLTIEELAEVLDRKRGTIYNQLGKGTFEIPTYIEGGKRFADYRDVATFLDAARERATTLA